MTNQSLNAAALRDRLHQLASREGIQRWDLGAACSEIVPFRSIAEKPSS